MSATIPAVQSSRDVLLAAILRQIEFYFGDSNYLGDKFLQAQIALHRGWVPVHTLLSFNRLKQLTTDAAVVVEAVKRSEGLVQVNEEGTMVRRVKPALRNPDAVVNSIYAVLSVSFHFPCFSLSFFLTVSFLL